MMCRRLLLLFAGCLVLLTSRGAVAAPIVIDAALAAAAPQSSTAPGAGICATAVHLSVDDALTTPEVAQFYLSQPVGMSTVDDRVQFAASVINFHNGDPGAATTDYPNPTPLPFTSLSSPPKAGNDRDIAMRVRGYVNITHPGIFTFAVQSSDGYRLALGGVQLLRSTAANASVRDSQQVQFAAAGLYPIELVYYKNSGAAVLDLAVSERADAEVRTYGQSLGPGFHLVNQTASTALYPALAGTSTCAECTSDAACGPGSGNYCRDGLCQSCVLDNHCGPNCTACDRTGQICLGGQCVSCTNDLQCGTGRTCDTTFGQCIARPELTYGGGGCSAARSAPGVPLGVLFLGALLALGILRRGRWSFRPSTVRLRSPPKSPKASTAAPLLAFLVTSLAYAGSVAAQDAPTQVLFNAQTFRPAIGPGNAFTVEGTLMPRQRWPLGGVLLEYANQPLRSFLNSGETYAAPVTGMLTAHLMPGFGITSWAALGVDLPVVLYQGFDERTPTTDVPTTPTVAGVGDLRLVGKFRIINNENGGIGLAAVPQLVFPTGSDASFRGDHTFGIEPRLALDYRIKSGYFKGGFVALNASYYARTYNRVVDFGLVRVADQVRYGVGVGLPLPKGLELVGEVNGAVGATKLDGGPLFAPLEGLVGGRWTSSSGVQVNVGGGGAFLSAPGTPNFRLFAGVSYSLPSRQRRTIPDDEERIRRVDPVDSAPRPVDVDSDGDGVFDSEDKCPQVFGLRTNSGCPVLDPNLDTDKDGLADRIDKCPNQPGPAANEGCPLSEKMVHSGVSSLSGDRDKDGVLDAADKCPDQAGSVENHGCPDPDTDGDGIVNRLDKCPKQPGPKETDGCPGILVGEDHVALEHPIRFQPGEALLEPASVPVVFELGKAIVAAKTVKKVTILVSADGDKNTAKKLAKKRVRFLQATLTAVGVPKKTLHIQVAKGRGGNEVTDIQVVKGHDRHHRKGGSSDAKDAGSDESTDVPVIKSHRHHRDKSEKKKKENKSAGESKHHRRKHSDE